MLSIAARRPHFRFCWRVVVEDDEDGRRRFEALCGSFARALSMFCVLLMDGRALERLLL
jgi:hypothetical protein